MNDRTSQARTLDPETLARLAGGLAHELKNPLSTLSLHLGMLREDWEKVADPMARRSVRTLETLLEEVGRLNEILEDFLRYARTDQVDRAEASLNEVVDRVVQFLAPEASAQGIEIRTYLDVDLPLMSLDAGRMRQALLNLLVNARQALGDGGGHVSVITQRDGEEVVLEVVDDGPGMEPEVLKRCFEVYFSTKRSGSGLGMAMARRIVEAHGGRMELESSPGHGTRVRIRLPLES